MAEHALESRLLLLGKKPFNVPLARPRDIFNDNFDSIKIKHRDGIKGNIQQNKRPFEEGVGSIS